MAAIEEKRRVLSIILFHPTVCVNGKETVKPHHGKFIDEISKSFSKVYLIAPYWKPHQFPEWMTKDGLMYNYSFKNPNIEIIQGISHRLLYPFRFIQQLYYFLRSTDVLFFTPSISALIFYRLLRLLKKNYYCYVAVEMRQFYRDRFKFSWFSRWIARENIQAVQQATGVLVTGAENLKQWPNHPNIERISPLLNLKKPAHFREKKDLKTESPIRLIYVGVITKRKQIEYIIDAVKILRDQKNDVELDIVGNTEDSEKNYALQLKSQVDRLQLSRFIHWSGYINDPDILSKKLSKSHFLILVSQYEGFPKVVYESMIHQAIPLLTPLGSYQGILEHKKNCLFVDEDIAESICRLVLKTSQQEKERIVLNNLKFMEDVFNRPPSAQFVQIANKSREKS